MKKFLAVILCILGFAGIVVLCYFFGYPENEVTIPTGNYYLEAIIEKTGEDDPIETEYTAGDLYLKIYDNNKIKSFSGETGFIASEVFYSYVLSGTNLDIYEDNQKKYTGMFAEELIIIEFSETVVVDGDEQEKTILYYYRLQD